MLQTKQPPKKIVRWINGGMPYFDPIIVLITTLLVF